MKPCQQFKDPLVHYFDDELDTHQKRELEAHLKICPQCERFLNRIRQLHSHLKELPTLKTSENFHILVRERIRRETARSQGRHASSQTWARRLVPAFGVVTVLTVVGLWLRDNQTVIHNPTNSSQGRSMAAQPSGEGSDDQVQYVIDEYPDRLSVSRESSEGALK